MKTFHLQIASPEGLMYDGEVYRLIVRAKGGDVGIMANHIDYVTSLGSGAVRVTAADGSERIAACSGGILSVKNKITRLTADTLKWDDA